MTCKIQRVVSSDGFVVLQISGPIDGPDIAILRELMEREETVTQWRQAKARWVIAGYCKKGFCPLG